MTSICLFGQITEDQITEDFQDGDFADGRPLSWSPSQISGSDDFAIISGELNSNGPSSTNKIFISSNQSIDFANSDVVWTFKVRYEGGAPSTNNSVEVYLMSDVADLSSTPNGYYIRLGENGSGDGIDLFKTNSRTAIVNDGGDLIANSLDTHIRATRTSTGDWTLDADTTGGSSFSTIGTITDTDFTSGDNFGFLVNHSSTRNQSYFFDDFTLTVTSIPDTAPPSVSGASAISTTSVDVAFNEDLDQVTSEDPSNYSINGGISVISAQRDASDLSIIHLTTSALTNGVRYTLTVNNVEDENGNAIVSPIQTKFTYLVLSNASFRDIQINEFLADPSPSQGLPEADFVELYNPTNNYYDLAGWQISDAVGQSGAMERFVLVPDGYVIVCSTSDVSVFETFGDVIGVTSFPNFNSSTADAVKLYDSTFSIIDSVSYVGTDVPDDGITLEQVSPNLRSCSGVFNFAPSSDVSGGTPNAENSVFALDIQGPNLVSAFALTEDSVRLEFDEVIGSSTLDPDDITFSPPLNIAEVSYLVEFPKSFFLKLEETLAPDVTIEVTVQSITDCAGNNVDQGTVSFSRLILSSASFRDIQINEFMAKPVPSIGLPEADFVELYNPTNNYYDLAGWQISDAVGQSGAMERFVLVPDGYVIVCSTSDVSVFETFGDVIGVTSFPNFNSSTNDKIILYNDLNTEIDMVSYTGDLPEDGITLEQVNPDLGCSGIFNFKPSLNIQGGTPGSENSVFMVVPDNFGPNLIAANAISEDSVRLDFDEALDPSTVDVGEVVFQPSVATITIQALPDYPQSLFVKIAEPIVANTSYEVSVSRIKDCAGNIVDETPVTFLLGLEPQENDVLLSEVLFNPKPDGFDFVEIYNPSTDKSFELNGWSIARLSDGDVEEEELIAPNGLLISPGQFLVFTDDVLDLQIQYPSGNSDSYIELDVPGYSNEEGSVVLLNSEGTIVQQFDYLDDYHYELLEDVDGVSLERVSYDQQVNDPNNWRSAASTVGFATPGNVNSQSVESFSSGGQLVVEPKVFIPGNSGSGRDFTTINYAFNQGGKFANVTIYDQSGRPVKQLANGASLSTSGFFRWDGITDRGGVARMGYFVVVFEVYNGNGSRSVLKETVVVGRNF